jgi:hypothetical protein
MVKRRILALVARPYLYPTMDGYSQGYAKRCVKSFDTTIP